MGRNTAVTQEAQEQQEQPTTEKVPVFTKEQLVASVVFSGYRDALNVILDDSKCYTVKEVEEELKEFKERKVR